MNKIKNANPDNQERHTIESRNTLTNNEENVKVIQMSKIESQKVKWLIYPYIALGKITVIQGNPGEGKTMLMMKLVSDLTRGKNTLGLYSEENSQFEPIKVIYQTAEDGISDTIKPRLEMFNADCEKVLYIDDSDKPLYMVDQRIDKVLEETKAKLLILDPLQAFLGNKVNINSSSETRPIFSKIQRVIEKHECALVLIGHLNKNNLGNANQRGMGSMDIVAAARSVLLVGRIKEHEEIRVCCQIKNSLAPEGVPFAFKLEQSGFEWLGEYEISADELLTGCKEKSKRQEAADFLKSALKNGALPSKELNEMAKQKGISERTLKRAKEDPKVYAFQKDNIWYTRMAGCQQ